MTVAAPPSPDLGSAHTDIMLRELYARAGVAQRALNPGPGGSSPQQQTFEIDRVTPIRRGTATIDTSVQLPWFLNNYDYYTGWTPPVPVAALHGNARILDVKLEVIEEVTATENSNIILIFMLGFVGPGVEAGDFPESYIEGSDIGHARFDHTFGEAVGEKGFVYDYYTATNVPDSRQRLIGNYTLVASFLVNFIIAFPLVWVPETSGLVRVTVDYVDGGTTVPMTQEELALNTVFVRT